MSLLLHFLSTQLIPVKFDTKLQLFDPFFRLLLKDAFPLTEDHFVIGNTPANLRLGLDIGGANMDGWTDPTITLAPSEILASSPAPTASFIYDYVEVDTID